MLLNKEKNSIIKQFNEISKELLLKQQKITIQEKMIIKQEKVIIDVKMMLFQSTTSQALDKLEVESLRNILLQLVKNKTISVRLSRDT